MTHFHPVKPFAARRDHRPPSTPIQRLKPTLSRGSTTPAERHQPCVSADRAGIPRGWLGAALYPVALSEAVSQQIGQDRGLMVLKVTEGGPAAAAGVIAGDILLTLGGTLMDRPSGLARSFGRESIGQQLELGLLRAGTQLTLNVTITARPSR